MQWLNYHHLYYFYVIADLGSVTEAAKKLKLAQSTLSAQLNIFEDALGYQLFERQYRKLELTQVGLRVYDYAHEIFTLGQELKRSLSDFEGSMRQSLRIGILDSIPKKMSKDLFRWSRNRFSNKITICEESMARLCQKLETHEIDLIFANDKPIEAKQSKFYSRLVGKLPVVWAGSPYFSELLDSMPHGLNHHNVILAGEDSPLRREVLEYFTLKHIQPKIVGEVDDLELQKMLVKEGHGVSALPLIDIEDELATGALINLSRIPFCHENLWFITASRKIQNPVVNDLVNGYKPL